MSAPCPMACDCASSVFRWGVLAVIYESRPNVTIDVAALALKSGNVVILRGGKETIRSNRVLVSGIHRSLESTGLSTDVVKFIDDPDRELVNQLLRMHQYVDMLIPRGGAGLHRFCRENSHHPGHHRRHWYLPSLCG